MFALSVALVRAPPPAAATLLPEFAYALLTLVRAPVQPLALPSPLVPIHSLKAVADAIPELGHNDVAIAFCYDDANLVTVNECGERYQSTCTGSNGQGECCSAAGKCGSEEAHCGAGMQEEFSHSKNLCEEGEARDGFDQQSATEAGLQQAQDQQAVAVVDPEKNAADLKALMESACDFDASGCDKETGICSQCYIHFEACKNGCAATHRCLGTQPIHGTRRELCGLSLAPPTPLDSDAPFCRLPRPHFEKDGTTPKEVTLDECMDQVAKSVDECSTCDTADSKEGYKVRTGEHNPPGIGQSSWMKNRFSIPPSKGPNPK